MTSTQLAPALITTFVAWRIYVRVRRSIGRQPLRPKRMVARIAIFGVVTLLLAAASVLYWPSLAGLGVGLLLGVPLAMVALRLTRFETTDEGVFYTPNTYLGLTVTLLLVGRIVYRFTVIFGGSRLGDPMAPSLMQSPITLVLFGVTAGYYIAYYGGVLAQAKKQAS